ncbi:3-oxoacyl-ACP synthase III family protein [Clostridium felsineum]|uniref:3-oxoacyl-[acyl-carrier-protein] synthase 3 n=1 Tax=Clostridium felsineum TaxID=36839 RepID=A0A1S8L2F0_9CLOT|nr:3-oxoacyl-[acyl-carrier-protein] synthase III C-terminal domain-containing protein [Clostridium felsineum]MCR3757608.1 hypothetical protein [Clostridium felsineum]URZ03205.1 3-oxoacyl-[acyl-carrier-protein] synthase 3 [Clostridium felsineum]URZ08455.1 3-oxoacyl-[acyl-carrier-protein] synthase 3 [Clostridium felsineum]URZ13486.1 3-oxoacyl-[acyl-carrier-protein] synthase 3 [Clostridium felsineum]URZ14542.1 3-oxoacyl-[acyl-carrier-protein] synthase 3 [Clostridium felsineum DSM 794]
MSISIAGIGYCIPEGTLDNKAIISRYIDKLSKNLNKEDKDFLEYSIERKLDFLQIKSRHYCKDYKKENSVTLAVDAAKNAIKKSNVPLEDIDLIICTGVTNPFKEPSFATVIAHMIGLKKGNAFDISDTCNGFMKSLELTDLYINNNLAKNVLVVACESGIEVLDNKSAILEIENIDEADYKVSSLFAGTSAVAAVYTKPVSSKKVLFYEEFRSFDEWDSSVSMSPKADIPPFSKMSKTSSVFWSDGRKIASKIISDMPNYIESVLKKHNIDKKNIKYVFSHQLGRNVTYSVLDSLGLDKDKMFPINTFTEYGNMGSCNIPIGIEFANEEGLLKPGDEFLLLSSACGLTFSVSYIVW